MATDIFPLEVWTSQITQASVPANENARRVAILNQPAISIESAQPGSPANDDVYILGAAPTGAQWASFDEDDVVIYQDGTWTAYAPFQGWLKVVDDDIYMYDAGAWAVVATAAPTAAYSESTTKTASATLAIGDAGKFILADHATVAIVITVPPNSSVPFDIDTEIHVRWKGVAAVSIAAGVGVTINYPASQLLNLKERYAVVTLKKLDTNSWALFGMLENA